jgi:uncharacterized membrane protein
MVYLPKIFGLILLHAVLGRVVSIPYAVILFKHYWEGLLIIFVIDVIQIPFYLWLYSHFSQFAQRYHRFYSFAKHKLDHIRASPIFTRASHWGKIGVIVISALPTFGGGIWSGTLLVKILRLGKMKGTLLIATGSFVGCFCFGAGLKKLLIVLYYLMDTIWYK